MHVGLSTFFQNLGQPEPDSAVYRQAIALSDMAEPMGFESIWSAEHHFTDYTMCPNVLQFLTYMAGRTRKAQLGSMVVVLPWHDPVRVAEEVAMLDNLSDGRLILGIGRGLGRVEFERFRVDMNESRERFTEYAEAILQGLEQGYLDYQGTHYRQPHAFIRPKPVRSFRGRIYASSISPESQRILADLGIGVMIIAQKPWDKTVEDLDNYRSMFRERNGHEAPKPIVAAFVAVHEDENVAREMMEKYIMGYSRSALEHYEFNNEGLANIKGYEYYGALSKTINKHGIDQFVRFLAELQVYGTPEQVTRKLLHFQELTDCGALLCSFQYGGMPFETAKQSMALFAEKVMPVLQKFDVGVTLGADVPADAAAAE